jgi:hypothetical protein
MTAAVEPVDFRSIRRSFQRYTYGLLQRSEVSFPYVIKAEHLPFRLPWAALLDIQRRPQENLGFRESRHVLKAIAMPLSERLGQNAELRRWLRTSRHRIPVPASDAVHRPVPRRTVPVKAI